MLNNAKQEHWHVSTATKSTFISTILTGSHRHSSRSRKETPTITIDHPKHQRPWCSLSSSTRRRPHHSQPGRAATRATPTPGRGGRPAPRGEPRERARVVLHGGANENTGTNKSRMDCILVGLLLGLSWSVSSLLGGGGNGGGTFHA